MITSLTYKDLSNLSGIVLLKIYLRGVRYLLNYNLLCDNKLRDNTLLHNNILTILKDLSTYYLKENDNIIISSYKLSIEDFFTLSIKYKSPLLKDNVKDLKTIKLSIYYDSNDKDKTLSNIIEKDNSPLNNIVSSNNVLYLKDLSNILYQNILSDETYLQPQELEDKFIQLEKQISSYFNYIN